MDARPLSTGWWWFSLVCGVLVPLGIFTWLGLKSPQEVIHDWLYYTCLVIAGIEVAGLAFWMCSEHRSRLAELGFGALFACGALFAACWSYFGLIGLYYFLFHALDHITERGWWSCVLLAASPVASFAVYGGSAMMATRNAAMLARRSSLEAG